MFAVPRAMRSYPLSFSHFCSLPVLGMQMGVSSDSTRAGEAAEGYVEGEDGQGVCSRNRVRC